EHRHDGRRTGGPPPPGRPARPDPGAGRSREQPQGRQHRAAEAPADGLHRHLRIGQELAGLRHDRRRVAADDQRDLQRLRPGLHADARAPGRRRARGAHHRDHRRPGADGCQRPLHRRHGHRHRSPAADPVQPARAAAHRLGAGVLLQRRLHQRRGCGHRGARRADREGAAQLQHHRRHVPALRGDGHRQRHRPHPAVRRDEGAGRGRDHRSGLQRRRVVRAHLRRGGAGRRPRRELHREAAPGVPVRRAAQDQGRGHQPDLRGPGPEDLEVDPVQGRRRAAAARAGVRGAGRDLLHLPGVRRHAAERGGPLVEDRGDQHRRRLRDADQRPRHLGAGTARAVGRAPARLPGRHPRLVRRDRPGLPQPEQAVRHAVGRGGAAHQDDPSPGLGADRCHLRLRRADDRPAPARHLADERPAPAAARQGQHGAGRGAQAGGHRHRRPRGRPGPRRGHSGRHRLLPGHRRRAAGQRHPHRTAPGRPGAPQADRAHAVGGAGGARRRDAQPARRRRRHPARGPGGADGRRGLRQELPGLGLGRRAGGGGDGGPGRDPRLTAEQPRDLHRAARADPQGLRQGQRRQARAVQRQLRGCLPDLQRRGRRLHRPGDDGRRRDDLRAVRGQALPSIGARAPPGRPRHQPGAGDVGGRGGGLLPRGCGAHPCGARRAGAARRRRARLPDAGPAAHHAVGRGAPAAQARDPHGGQGRRARPRRADHRSAPGRRRAAARAARPAGRLRHLRAGHRALPGGDGARRLDHRPGPGCRPRRRTDRLRGHPGRPGRGPLHAHRRAPGGVRRRL
ncbi:MAG: Excinuclease ABC subunit A paralog of unknown function, partial [uncultured Frankineae bacterium]